MRTVQLNLPEEIVQQAQIPYEGVRDLQGIVVAIAGISYTAGIVTLATLKQYAPALAAAIRRWHLHQDTKPTTLTVQGDGIDLKSSSRRTSVRSSCSNNWPRSSQQD